MALNAEQLFDVGLGLEGVHCIITGATGQIGSVVVKVCTSLQAVVPILTYTGVPCRRLLRYWL